MLSTAVFFALLTSVLAQNNDWSKPCLEGECFWDLPASDTGSGTMRVWGANTAISDITNAAGWTILDCDPALFQQNIRLVCTGNDDHCDHLFQGDAGAEHTLVRLPTSCGASPFARVARAWVHADQTIPDDVAATIDAKLRKRQDPDAEAPPVLGLAIDTSFADVDPDVNGNVSVAVSGTTIPGQEGNLTVTPPAPCFSASQPLATPRSVLFHRECFQDFDKDVTKSLPPLDLDKSLNLFSESISCPSPAVSASVSADIDGKVHAVVSLGMSAVGTIIPPKLTEFGVFVGLDASLTGTLELKGSATGTIDSGSKVLFQTGIPGLDFPGILTIGPTFKISAQATATLDANVDAKIVLAYNVANAKLFFPHSDSLTSGGDFNPADSPLSLSVAPSISSKGVVSAHIIPRIDLGISGLAGLAQATVFLDLDASASMTLSLDANANAGVSTTADPTASASVKGCIDVAAGFDVNAGADGSFFGIFDKSTQVNLFSKKFDIFNKCAGASTRRDVPLLLEERDEFETLGRRADLGCPAFIANLVSAFSDAVPAASIKAA
ncbi:hypothetical protein C8F01DRAFT_284946 [Mycena amicta]|nr:hypothetical protein C8F01DRAFT_284946 [Mycena amicta]